MEHCLGLEIGYQEIFNWVSETQHIADTCSILQHKNLITLARQYACMTLNGIVFVCHFFSKDSRIIRR
jgi:hypothetical protein